MEWQELENFTLTNNWQYSQRVRGRDFKIVYLSSPLTGRDSIGTIALADVPDDASLESSEFFKPQRISSYLTSEIIRFPDPPREWLYRLAIKKLTLPNQFVPNFEVRIYMPSYSSGPAFGGSTNVVIANTVAADSTKSVTLSAANPTKIGSSITNNSKVGKLYVSIGSAASLTNYDKILNYLETFETPFNWAGDVFGIWDKADSAGSARVRDFS